MSHVPREKAPCHYLHGQDNIFLAGGHKILPQEKKINDTHYEYPVDKIHTFLIRPGHDSLNTYIITSQNQYNLLALKICLFLYMKKMRLDN